MTTLSFVNQRTFNSALSVLQENGFCECSSCNDFVSEDDSRTVDEDTYCEGCAETSNYCEGLEEYTFNDVTEVEGHYYCDSYRNDNCWQDGSGEWFQNDTASVTYSDTDEMWTLDYAQENGYYDSDNDEWYSEQPEGSNCEEDESSSDPINPSILARSAPLNPLGMEGYHSDKIRSTWIIPKGAIGVEIETYCKGSRSLLADTLRSDYSCAAERDGSLDDNHGIEVITPPLAPSALSEQLPKILETMRQFDCESWKKQGYGIHVNIDCRDWSDETKATFCNQFNRVNATWLAQYAGRGDTTYTKLKDYDNECDIPVSKYSAAGVKTGGRCEVRIFRSTLRTESVLGYVSLCKDALRYSTETLTTKPSQFLQWLKHNASPTTRKHLEYKGIITPMPFVSSGF